MDFRNLGPRLDQTKALDAVTGPARRVASTVVAPGAVRDALQGTWLGHPLHPLLTDLPIGFWTSAWTLDIVGGKAGRPAAQLLTALGVACALPTAVTGLADWTDLDRSRQRSGVVHAVANTAATALYAMSWLARRRGRYARGVALGWAGASAATVGGYLGGHLVFGSTEKDSAG